MIANFFPAALSGFLLGASLIIAIGAQNAFILRQGLLRQHVFVLCLICALSDAVLIAAGVAGLGTLISQSPTLITVVTIGGALFLFSYAIIAFRRAMKPDVLKAANAGEGSLKAAVAACLAFTFLNPHVYLDTVVLLGSLSARFDGPDRMAYGLGAALASFVWFFGLGYGARLLQPIFAKESAWRMLDILIGLVMAAIGVSLSSRLFG
jgi:L-lysine exporter family protein LysE/ArgO